MADWLSEEWAAQAAGASDLLAPLPGLSGTVDLAVSAGKRQEVHLHWTYSDGVPGGGSAGPSDGADLALTLASQDAIDVLSGVVEPSVSFMRGRLKAAGDGALLLAFLASTTTKEFSAWRERVAALAEETSTGA